MLLSECIAKLQELYNKEGDSNLLIDVPERNNYVEEFSIDGRYYQGNHRKNGVPIPNAFIRVKDANYEDYNPLFY